MSEKPAVLVFTTAYFPFVGGAEVAIQEVARRLKNEYDFFIFTSRMDGKLPAREKRLEGLVIRIGFGNKFDKFWLLIFGWFVAWRELRKWHRKIIFWVMDFSFGAAVAGFLKIFYPKIPLVFTIQYGYGDERVKKGRGGLMNLAFRLILSQADYVTAISNYLLNLCKQYGYIGEEAVIHNGVDLKKFIFRNKERGYRVAVVTGNIWEAVMLAGKSKLHNLIQIIDRNNIQIDGNTEDIMPLEPLRAKYEAFNWHVLEVDGHNFDQIVSAVEEAKAIYEKPKLIIAHTIPGRGVDFMERDYKWHGIPPNREQAKVALDELRTLGGKIQSEHQ